MKKVFWIAGENSGDQHAALVLKQLNTLNPNLQHYGIGGPLMQQQGFKALYPFERFKVMGFVEVVKHLNFFRGIEKDITTRFNADKPDLLVLVDYPGFNFRIARLAHSLGIKILYYISPQFWAWKFKRVYKLAKWTNKVACIFPFEETLLKQHGVNAEFVGHPAAEEIVPTLSKQDFRGKFNLPADKQIVGFFPGSRVAEITRLLPQMAKAANLLTKKGCHCIINKAPGIDQDLFNRHLGNCQAQLITGYNFDLMSYSDFIVAKSGTTSLETAFCGTPMLIAYITSPISYLLARYFIKIRRIGMPNIVLDRDIIPELIQGKAQAANLAKVAWHYLSNPQAAKQQQQALQSLKHILGDKSPSVRTAQIITELLPSN